MVNYAPTTVPAKVILNKITVYNIVTLKTESSIMKMSYRYYIAVILAVSCCFLASCAGGQKVKKPKYECSPRIAQAIQKYKKKKYSAAKTMLEDVKIQCAGSDALDTAQYYIGMSLLQMKLYPEAKLEFTQLIQEFPNSEYYEEALFRVAYSVYKGSRSVERDQTETREAYRLFADYLENYPSSTYADSAQKYIKMAVNKLAQKEYESARFYQKIGEKEAAIVCYKTFITEYPGSEFTPMARLNLGQTLFDLKRLSEAKEVLGALITQEPDSDIAKKADELLARYKE
jgi:outer membrane protein assembly factor BamD